MLGSRFGFASKDDASGEDPMVYKVGVNKSGPHQSSGNYHISNGRTDAEEH